jgi:hypothetical protein
VARGNEMIEFMYKRRRLFLLLSLFSILLTFTISTPARGQESPQLKITGIDASEFPIIRFTLIASDTESVRIPTIDGVEFSENGEPVSEPELDETLSGIELIVVLDANSTYNTRDELGGLTRREKVRDSIVRFSNQFMDPTQKDRVSIVVPDEDAGRLLLDRAPLSMKLTSMILRS